MVKVESLADVFFRVDEVASSLGHLPWWRGCGDAKYRLIPSVHRREDTGYEMNVAHRFRLQGGSREANCPAREDLLEWLFLMQHSRCPTRLLDWSESPLVALFFAVCNPDDGIDGALWALDAGSFNVSQGGSRYGPFTPR